MEKGTAYIEYTAKTFTLVTSTLHAEADEQDATASEVRQSSYTCLHDSVARCCSQLRQLQFATNCTKTDHEMEALLAPLASQAAPQQPA